MSMTDPIADLLTRIRNAQMAKHTTVDVPASRMKAEIVAHPARTRATSTAIELVEDDAPGRRCASSSSTGTAGERRSPVWSGSAVPDAASTAARARSRRVLDGLGITILSTPKGVMTGTACRRPASAAKSCATFGERKESGERMSRIGRLPIPLSRGVKVDARARAGDRPGPEGHLDPAAARAASPPSSRTASSLVKRTRRQQAAAGAARADARAPGQRRDRRDQGFTKDLEIQGVGYRAQLSGQDRDASSWATRHPIDFPMPEGIQITVEKQTKLTVTRHRPPAGGPGRGGDPRAASAGRLQGQGHPLRRRALRKKAGKTGAK